MRVSSWFVAHLQILFASDFLQQCCGPFPDLLLLPLLNDILTVSVHRFLLSLLTISPCFKLLMRGMVDESVPFSLLEVKISLSWNVFGSD